ncbi:hypothetical protein F4679DRAFT_587404 [Xylaria curta]|nr:hypothetical protein F4679DRAFT_587404 [Xylaria curta]
MRATPTEFQQFLQCLAQDSRLLRLYTQNIDSLDISKDISLRDPATAAAAAQKAARMRARKRAEAVEKKKAAAQTDGPADDVPAGEEDIVANA